MTILLVHDKFKVRQTSPLQSVVLNVLGPDGTLEIHQDPGLWLVELDHDDGTEVSPLVPVGIEVSRESSVRRVGHRSDVLHVGVVLPVTVQPGHVHPGAGLRLAHLGVAADGIVLGSALLVPDLVDVLLQLPGHGGAGVDLLHGVRHRLPVVDLVHLEKYARLTVSVPVTQIFLYCNFLHLQILPVILLRDTLVVRLRVAQPFLVKLAALVLRSSSRTERNLMSERTFKHYYLLTSPGG